MTKRQKRELQERFFRQAGPNIDVVRRMFEHIHDYSFYIIDKDDLIIASNPRNLENGKESRGITPGEFRRLHRRDVAMPR